MMHTIRNRAESEEGFTLIELLVVILIIGILAAIAIPSFLNQRYKGQDACAKSMAKQMQTAAKTFQTERNTFAGMSIGSLSAIESSITGTTAQGNCAPNPTNPIGQAASGGGCNATAPNDSVQFCVSAVSMSSNTFSISESSAGVARGCTVGSGGNAGGCTRTSGSNGSW